MKKGNVAVLIAVALAGCRGGIFDSHVIERTYPAASDFPVTMVHDILTNPVQDTFNIHVYVTGARICPENARCFLADGISIADEYATDPPYESIDMGVERPGQFVIGKRYVMSVNLELVEVANSDTTWQVTLVELLGYDFFSNRALTSGRTKALVKTPHHRLNS
jgi:hypothetical protein